MKKIPRQDMNFSRALSLTSHVREGANGFDYACQ
jgi:hypothetical protein